MHSVLHEFWLELEAALPADIIAMLTRRALTTMLFHYYNGHSVAEIIVILVNGHGDPSSEILREYAGLVQETREIHR